MESMTLADAVFEARRAALEALRRWSRGNTPEAALDERWEAAGALMEASDRLEAAEAALRADAGNGQTALSIP
jgi:hypothetical protein